MAPEATVVGSDEFKHVHMSRLDVQYFIVIAVPAVQVIVTGEVDPTVTEP